MAQRQHKVRMSCDVRQRVQQTEWHLPTNGWWGRNPLQNFLYNQQLASTTSLALCATKEVSSLPTKNLPTSRCWPFGEPTTSPTLCATKQEPTNNNICGPLFKLQSLKLAKQARQSARQRLHFILRRQTVGIPAKPWFQKNLFWKQGAIEGRKYNVATIAAPPLEAPDWGGLDLELGLGLLAGLRFSTVTHLGPILLSVG